MRLASLLSTFFKFFMSLFLWGDAVAVLLGLCLLPALAGGSLQTQTWQQSSATHPSETVWCLTPVRRTFRLFGGPVLPLWPAEGVRRGAAAGEGLGGFLGRTFVNVRVSFFLETAPLPTTQQHMLYIHRNITAVWIWHTDLPESKANTHLDAGSHWRETGQCDRSSPLLGALKAHCLCDCRTGKRDI